MLYIYIWLVVQYPSWKMMEFVNGKDDIPYMKWKKCSKPPTRLCLQSLPHSIFWTRVKCWSLWYFMESHATSRTAMDKESSWVSVISSAESPKISGSEFLLSCNFNWSNDTGGASAASVDAKDSMFIATFGPGKYGWTYSIEAFRIFQDGSMFSFTNLSR